MFHVDSPIQPLILDLCAGAGMLGEAARLATGGRVLAHVERESYAAACLLARMEESSLEPAPVWCGDLGEFPTAGFRGLVDILAAGLPCQPYSLAGKRRGNADERSFGADGESGPLPGTLRIIAECLPPVVFLENVPAWVASGWFREFGDALCGMGYEIEDPFFLAAKDVGASHKRERVFIMAVASGSHSERWRVPGILAAAQGEKPGEAPEWEWDGKAAEHRGAAMAQPDRRSREQRQCEPQRRQEGRTAAGGDGETVEKPHRRGSERGQGEQRELWSEEGGERPDDHDCGSGEAVGDTASLSQREPPAAPHPQSTDRRAWDEPQHSSLQLADPSEQGLPQPEPASRPASRPAPELCGAPSDLLFAPGPSGQRWAGILAGSPWLAPAIEPGVHLLADGLAYSLDASRADQLRVCGNGVVPLQAAVAFALLARRAAR